MAAATAVIQTIEASSFPYAGLVHAAHMAEGPVNLVKAISNAAYLQGFLVGGAVFLALGAYVVAKTNMYYIKNTKVIVIDGATGKPISGDENEAI